MIARLAFPLGILFILICFQDASSRFTDCGGWLEKDKGVIHTPNFPARFPTPIKCDWVIHNPDPEKKIITYFTQYFLKNSFHLSEYDEYKNEHDYKGVQYLGEINYENEYTSLATYKPYLVIRFKVHEIGKMHLRVEEFLKDVYGFNITYEIVDNSQDIRETCSAHDCSFLGHCVASSNYENYRCECFPKFFGEYCQYGPFCDPDKGKNMCENNGKCRYFMGSLVNICDCPRGYTGDHCQEIIPEDHSANDCRLGCSHGCERSEFGDFYCICGDGFRLDVDNITCIEKEMYRISVQLPLKGVVFNTMFLDRYISRNLNPFKLVEKLRAMGLHTATRLKYDRLSDNGGQKELLFHFFLEIQQLPLVNTTIHDLITHGRFLNISVDVANIKYIIDPEMKLLFVENYDQRPAIEDQLLTIACTARGSSDMTFHWYKDGYLVDVNLSDRNAWVVRIPRTMKDKQMSVLNIDGVTVYDKGVFTCRIEDFGHSQNKSVIVDVITYPHIEVTPLAMSLEAGQQVGFRCVTPDDTRQTFQYTWFKNGVEIEAGNGEEIIEDLLPAGSRLLVRRVTSDANYTCYITNSAGTSNLTAYVFVLPGNQTNQVCPSEKFGGVKWKSMGAGDFDIERCPTDTGGYARRRCDCWAGTCKWAEPNFAKCQSGHLVVIYDRLEKLRLGYQHDNTSDIFDTLYKFINIASKKMLAGDVDVSCSILHTFVETLLQHPVHAPTTGSFSFKSLINVMYLLLQQAIDSNIQEQKDLYVAQKLLDITFMLSKTTIPSLKLTYGDFMTTPTLGFSVSNLSVIPAYMKPTITPNTYKIQTYSEVPVRARSKRDYPVKTNGGIYDKILTNGNLSYHASIVKKEKLTVKFYFKQMFSLMKRDTSKNDAYVAVSDMFSIYLLNDMDSLEERLEINLQHNINQQYLVQHNETRCVKWVGYRMSLYGYWDESNCVTVHKNISTTTCWCRIPGTFAVFIKPDETGNQEVLITDIDTVLLVGCILSLCGLCATIIVYMFTWRHLVGNIHCIHINLVLSLAVVNMLCLMCLGKSNIERVCVAGKILIQFFYLAAFAFIFVEAVHMFVSVHGGNRIKKTCIKYFIIGWGLPTVVIGGVVIASERLGYDKDCIDWCWLSENHWHFYSFIIPMIILILAQTGLTFVAVLTVYRWKEEWRFAERRQYMCQGGQMMMIQTLLTASCITGSMILQQNGQMYSYIFIISDISLSTILLLFLCVLKKQVPAAILHIFKRTSDVDYKRKFSTSSFRTFMMPEKVDESNQTVEKVVQDHHNAVNRSTYTAEKKKQLRFLLGSSGNYSDASTTGSGSTSGSGSASGSDGPMRFRPRYSGARDNGDSGFSEETGSDRSSYKNNCLVELHPLPSTSEGKESHSGAHDNSAQSYVLADFPQKTMETSVDRECILNKPLIKNIQKPTQSEKKTRFIFATDDTSVDMFKTTEPLISDNLRV
ncbi:uncharacterized protein LOC126819404 isoform X2 [Patella vulgata]|uniref:uncharacterized protein LOC126819404 isoform X2 n=1 Tax=Patella vulgata TaxID=6465 RepID=UPI00217FF2AC|nr:uncharacterized protein LOC126819404 isoform X2 [Patella vulgata]